MTRIIQQREEERIARLLFSILNLGPIQSIRRGNPAPDIVASLVHRKIGLEVTEIFVPFDTDGLPHQAMENYRGQLLEACATEWQRRRSPHVEVHVHFNTNVLIPKNQIGALASRLCDVVTAHLPPAEGYATMKFEWEQRNSFLPEQVIAIHMVRFGDDGESYWLSSDSGFLAPLTNELVQTAIDRKSLGDFRELGAESWLVIVANGCQISGSFEISDPAIQHGYKAHFKRMFILELFSMRVYEIHTSDNVRS